MRSFLMGVAMLIAAMAPAAAQTFDNKSVVALHEAGLGETAIAAKVKALPCGYDVSTEALIALKRSGVPDAVIAAMVERCNASASAQGIAIGSADPAGLHAPGIYLVDDRAQPARMQMLRPSKASTIKVSGNGSILFPYVGHLLLPGGQSHVAVGGRHPTFYFYFLAHDRNVSDFGTPNSIAAQSPEEFSLVRFKANGDEREVGIGKLSLYSGGRKGIDPKDAIRFQSTEAGETAFKVDMPGDLEPGEYAFVLTGANNSARVYDFTVP